MKSVAGRLSGGGLNGITREGQQLSSRAIAACQE